MSDGNSIIDLLARRQDREQFRRKNWFGTFAEYLPPGACEVPDITILHDESPSPFTPLGAKGLGEGNCMSTPVCLANAVCDALGIDHIDLPLMPAKIAALMQGDEPGR